MSWRAVLRIALLGSLVTPTPLLAQVRPCDWQATDPAPHNGRTTEIQWGADADRADASDEFFNMTRFVINHDDQTLKIHWPAGRMLVLALAPGHIAYTCNRHLYGRDIDQGLLFPGRDFSGIPTRTYVGVQEALDLTTLRHGEPLELSGRLAIGPADAPHRAEIDVGVRTWVVRHEEGFAITYVLMNASNRAIGLSAPIPDEALGQMEAFPRRMLEPGETSSATIQTAAEPSTAVLPLSVADTEGALIAIVYVTTLVPAGGWRW